MMQHTSQSHYLQMTPKWRLFLFHNVIQLRYLEHSSEIGRAINVIKMRNSEHDK